MWVIVGGIVIRVGWDGSGRWDGIIEEEEDEGCGYVCRL